MTKIIFLAWIGGLAAFGCGALSRAGYEEYGHTVVVKEGRYEIRAYDSAIAATTVVDAEFRRAGGRAFGRLGGYIFGDNQQSNKIAMTVPVEQAPAGSSQKIAMTVPVLQRPGEAGWRMTFIMPSQYTMDSLPQPVDPQVSLVPVPARTSAAFRYSGRQVPEDLDRFAPDLIAWLSDQGYEVTTPPRLAAYDPPWTPGFLRRNEVLFDVVKRESQ